MITVSFNFSIATFKPGYVPWNDNNISNQYLKKIILVESNATFGNSGSPVFSNQGNLLGILVGGYKDINELRFDGKVIIDTTSKKTYYTETRSGVSIVIKANNIKDLLNHVESLLK